eukprot:TRINITY_DN13219_c0_g1_i2.p1 TRINITY_DN13219_c0_g1~~TRINITY_DN13219_c0_g1_i2.p1  ORF type:complete len:118 (-),score=25.00 TRINITY_DN13219_c0_g1_i2:40-393(-)
MHRLSGDLSHVVAQYHNDPDRRRKARQDSLAHYHTSVIRFDCWTPGEPHHVRGAINYATFCEDVLQEHDQALTLLTLAFNAASAFRSKDDQEQKQITEMLKEIKSKLVLWFPGDEDK